MKPIEETKPNRSDVFAPEDSYDDSGPGCAVWGIVGFMGLVFSVLIVLTAAFAGFSRGLMTAHTTATAVRQSNIIRQCEQLPADVAAGRMTLIENRLNDLLQNGVLPACAQPYVIEATRLYQESLATSTSVPSPTIAATLELPSITEVPQVTSEAQPVAPAATSEYDLVGLLQEARDQIATGTYSEAIRTLEAISAIDPDFQPNIVNNLLFNALTARATLLYRSDGSLAEAIRLTNQAEQYGDVADLNYERTVAQYYLDAQGFLGINYPAAIQQLNLVRSLSSNYRDTNTLLAQQYAAYGDAFVSGNEPCQAIAQFDAALALIPQPAVQTRRDAAQALCSGAATPDPDSATTPGVAPVGQSGP